jgi:integrase
MNAENKQASQELPPETISLVEPFRERKAPKYTKVKDSSGRPIRGLWERNGRFVAQITLPGRMNATKVPLKHQDGQPVQTVAEAAEVLRQMKILRSHGTLPLVNCAPTLSQLSHHYLAWLKRSEAKSWLTYAKESAALAKWVKKLGALRINQLKRIHIHEFIAWRKEVHGISNRTANLDVLALKNCLKHAQVELGDVRLPTDGWIPLKHQSPKRPLWTTEQVEKLCQSALNLSSSGLLLHDYLRLLAYSGARRNEALHLTWSDIDWEKRRLEFRVTKYRIPRSLDFNPKLEAHLKDMFSRRAPDGKWLFPSSFSSGIYPALGLQSALNRARAQAGLPDFQFHDLRHFFISKCVMAGVDYLTIAKWVGHSDGGVLIGFMVI